MHWHIRPQSHDEQGINKLRPRSKIELNIWVSGNEPFAELAVIVFSYFFQLPPVKGLPVYSSGASVKDFIALDLWGKFQIVELTEVMHQRSGFDIISLLIKIREAEIDEQVENTLNSRFLKEKSFP